MSALDGQLPGAAAAAVVDVAVRDDAALAGVGYSRLQFVLLVRRVCVRHGLVSSEPWPTWRLWLGAGSA